MVGPKTNSSSTTEKEYVPCVAGSYWKPVPPGTKTNAHAEGSVCLVDSKGPEVTMRKDPANTSNCKPCSSASSSFPREDTKPLRKAQSGLYVRGYHNSQTIPSLSGEHQVGHLGSENLLKQRVNGEAVHGYNRYGTNKNYSSRRSSDFSSELVRGPRANRGRSKSYLGSLTGNVYINQFLRRDNYNRPDFQIQYEEAKFFMIKSFNEDDIHKSIKYSVWASTPNGNTKLDAAFWGADRIVEKGSKCPIFLFFSVNGSGQFVGLAEMTGPVDFNKNMNFWQQEIWNGFFPVKWHIIKDIPNKLFHNITLENNDNNAVTFSKDTQEIGLPQGLKMLQIFKNYQLLTALLDDFEYYEQREKSLRFTRNRRSAMMDPEREFCEDSSSMKHLEAAVSKMKVSKMNVTAESSRSPHLMPSPASTGRPDCQRRPKY
ncbi:YTH domain-containing family protein 1-like isoform X1 [Canna indica]|uniref:YTH domain-containing family protein n=1 Tax=Canna indica TaxID=4628 RepID=A0AAQ3K7E9_9LILI|nr:YTH domain-containing family protein 1-like isoform X1 [Canna indica]